MSEYNTCYLECTENKFKVKFQVLDKYNTSSFCLDTLNELNISKLQHIRFYFDNNFIEIPITINNLNYNILGRDILSYCNLVFDKGLKLKYSS